jgi:uncharacterized damage-inducible protein DinB
MMTEIKRIQDQLRRAFDGTAWPGPAVRELLAGVSAVTAAAKPLPEAHSIWEIVLHIAAWEGIVRRRLEGEIIPEISPEMDWPPAPEPSEDAWRATLLDVQRNHMALREAIARLDDARLRETVPGTEYSFYFMLHGVIQHDLYHAGQIAILKKAASQ